MTDVVIVPIGRWKQCLVLEKVLKERGFTVRMIIQIVNEYMLQIEKLEGE